VEACTQEGEGPNQLSVLYQAMPLVTEYLKTIDARNEQRVNELKASIGYIIESQAAQSTQSQLQLFTSGRLTFRLEAPQLPPLSITASSQYTSARASIAATPLGRSPSPPLRQRQRQRQPELEPPKYRMCRAVRTVEALWREWTVGLQGSPSIDMLDRRWGSRWRAGRQNELQWYSLRLEVIKEIRRIAQAQRTGEEAAMWQVNLQQQQTNCSLDQLCKRLRAGRKARSS
jgi:hypothetical protein